MKKYRDATIRVVPNGFIIKIGCQEVVAETTDKLLKMIKNYLDNPEKTEKELLEKSMVFGEPTLARNYYSIPDTPWTLTAHADVVRTNT